MIWRFLHNSYYDFLSKKLPLTEGKLNFKIKSFVKGKFQFLLAFQQKIIYGCFKKDFEKSKKGSKKRWISRLIQIHWKSFYKMSQKSC
jgi:hypothetical protein